MRIPPVVIISILASPIAYADFVTGPPQFIEDAQVPDPHDTGTERYLSLGVLTAPTGEWFGLRAQLDFLGVGGLTLGAAGTLFGRGVDERFGETFKASGVAFLAYTKQISTYIKLRGQIGFGGAVSVEADEATMSAVTKKLEIVEGSLLVTARANHDWSVVAGPVYQRGIYDASWSSTMVFVGLQRRF